MRQNCERICEIQFLRHDIITEKQNVRKILHLLFLPYCTCQSKETYIDLAFVIEKLSALLSLSAVHPGICIDCLWMLQFKALSY